jgi:hypothetical protein
MSRRWVGEALGFAGESPDLRKAEARAGDVGFGVLFARVHSDVIFAGTAGVDKFDLDVVADTLEVTVAPEFPRIRGR